jgi:hypothetical protein
MFLEVDLSWVMGLKWFDLGMFVVDVSKAMTSYVLYLGVGNPNRIQTIFFKKKITTKRRLKDEKKFLLEISSSRRTILDF